jgi:hypothetical protein
MVATNIDSPAEGDVTAQKHLADDHREGSSDGKTITNESEDAGVSKDVEKGAPTGDDAVVDTNIVDWDGPDDPANPRNWSSAIKLINVLLISLSVLYVMLATTTFAPAAPSVQHEFGYKNGQLEILTITVASLGFALGQLFIPPLSEVFGRLPIYRLSAIFYIGFTAGIARSTNVAEFLVFRLLTGLSASSYLSTGGGTVADLLPKEERGVAMALFTSGPIFGPVCAPSSAVEWSTC